MFPTLALPPIEQKERSISLLTRIEFAAAWIDSLPANNTHGSVG